MVNIFRIVIYVPRMSFYARHPEKYSEKERYALAKRLVKIVIRTSRAKTIHKGTEHLPASGGYIMFANHQGRYDPMGILSGHERPCSFLLDKRRANQPLCREFAALLDAVSIDKESSRDQIRALKTLANGVKDGRCFIVFPEGTYNKGQGNRTNEFKDGCFLAAMHARCPIIPVTVIDSYKVYGENSLRQVTTKVIYHKPLFYEDYKGLKVKDISRTVKGIIDREIERETSI